MSAIIPLGTFAEHLRDGNLLDMRVLDVGTLRRVQLREIVVRRESDWLTVRQTWLDRKSERRDEQTYHFDAEHVRWCRLTEIELLDVRPPGKVRKERVAGGAPATLAYIMPHVLTTVCWFFKVKPAQVKDTNTGGAPHQARCCAMLLAYATTNATSLQIAHYFGYLSPTPVTSASAYFWDAGPWKRQLIDALNLLFHRLQARPKRTAYWSAAIPRFI